MTFHRIALLLTFACAGLLAQAASAANLIRNGSFEQTPCVTPCMQGQQGVMATDWLTLNINPDTYSVDGSFGLNVGDFGNFTGATAQDGVRFVAGWSSVAETFGQALAAPLVPGQNYTIGAWLRQAVRADLAFPGTYRVELWDSPTSNANKVVLGQFGPTTGTSWISTNFTFTAPAEAATYTVIAFVPIATTNAGTAYPGIDNITLDVTGGGGGGGGGGGNACGTSAPPTIVIGGCDTGVPAVVSGVCIASQIAACEGAKNHGQYASCVAHITNDLRNQGVIVDVEKGRIQSCAAQSK